MLKCHLAEVLSKQHMSQRELARRTGKRLETIRAMANDTLEKFIPIDILEAICEVLEVGPGDLYSVVNKIPEVPEGAPEVKK